MAIGDITTSAIASLEFQTSTVNSYGIAHHSGTTYVIVYTDGSANANIGTVDISDDGTAITETDAWQYNSIVTVGIALIKISSGLFLVISRTSSGVEAFTFRVSNSGVITKSKVDSEVLDAGLPYWPRIVRITGTDYYAFTYRWSSGANNEFRVRSLHINPLSGVITNVDYTTAGAGTYGRNSSIVELPDNMLAVVYQDAAQQGHLRTLTISPTTGALSAFLADNTSMSGSNLFWHCSAVSVHENGDMILFAYRGAGEDGYLQTARVNTTTGAVTLLNNLEFDTNYGYNIELQKLDHTGNVLLGYNGYSASNPTSEGYLKTFSIDIVGTITANDSWAMGADEWAKVADDSGRWLPIGELNSGVFAMIRARTSNDYGTITTVQVEADLTSAGPQATKLFAPVDALPVLTNGRNTSGYGSGHEPKYTLDNDPDTWWEPDWYVTSALYYDLGSAVPVDAIALWLRNYNENYVNDKAWRISYSNDDSTYTPIAIKEFASNRTSYSPVVVDELAVAVSARYWRIEFLYFANVPQTIIPEISAVWFMNKYPLPWKHQRPEANKILYHNNETVSRSGHRFASPAGEGKQRVIQRQFAFTTDTNQWSNLSNAYHAARGRNLPIIMQSEFNSNEYYALQFETPLAESRQEHDFWLPNIVLRELGHERVTFQDKSLIQPHHNSAVYHFRGNANDSGLNGRDWTENFSPAYSADGITEQNTTVIDLASTADLHISSGSATWADMGTQDFTIECWFRGVNGALLCRKASENFGLTNAGFFMGISGWKLRLSIHDGTTAANLTSADFDTVIAGTNAGDADNQWHCVVMVVDRTNDLMHGYANGGDIIPLGDHAQVDISALTGSLSRADQNLMCSGLNKAELFIDELTITRGYAMSAQEIANRFLGRANYGNWGM